MSLVSLHHAFKPELYLKISKIADFLALSLSCALAAKRYDNSYLLNEPGCRGFILNSYLTRLLACIMISPSANNPKASTNVRVDNTVLVSATYLDMVVK